MTFPLEVQIARARRDVEEAKAALAQACKGHVAAEYTAAQTAVEVRMSILGALRWLRDKEPTLPPVMRAEIAAWSVGLGEGLSS